MPPFCLLLLLRVESFIRKEGGLLCIVRTLCVEHYKIFTMTIMVRERRGKRGRLYLEKILNTPRVRAAVVSDTLFRDNPRRPSPQSGECLCVCEGNDERDSLSLSLSLFALSLLCLVKRLQQFRADADATPLYRDAEKIFLDCGRHKLSVMRVKERESSKTFTCLNDCPWAAVCKSV